jgi:transposase
VSKATRIRVLEAALRERDDALRERDALIARLLEEIVQLKARVQRLEEQVAASSRNSSKPPSSDPPSAPRSTKEPTGRKPGGQPGHQGHQRTLVPPEDVDQLHVRKPDRCACCGGALHGDDPDPRRHQVVELPPIKPLVIEWQLHALGCPRCGAITRAELPAGVPLGGFGPRVQATAALLSGAYRLSHRMTREAMQDLFGVTFGLGTVTAFERAASAALAQPVEEATRHAQQAPLAHVDETSWRQARKKAWLWVMATPLVTIFLVHASRGAAAAEHLLQGFRGYLVTDRWAVYNRWTTFLRQLCWAHLKRDFIRISERRGDSARIGTRLLAEMKIMFAWWHRVRDGTMARSTFIRYMRPVRGRVAALLVEGSRCPHQATAGTCREILKLAPALWTFVHVADIEPTNNFGERQIRRGVMWRKTSFGTHSEAGSRFVERIMTTSATLRQQGRNVVDFVMQAMDDKLHGRPAPSLLPPDMSPDALTAAA